jgi:chromosome partitioning protein
VLTINALTAAEFVVVPMNPALYSMQGTNDLMATMTKVRRNLNGNLKILGVVINAFDSVPVITRQIKKEIEESFLRLVFKTTISKSIKIEEAIAQQKGVICFDCKLKEQFISLGNEFITRIAQMEHGKSFATTLVKSERGAL